MDYRVLAEELLDIQFDLQLASINRQISKFSQGMYFALHYLFLHKDKAHPKELSRGMAVSTARVAALLNQMEERGLILRNPDDDDNRQVVITITEKGEQILLEEREQILADFSKALEKLGSADAAEYLRIQRGFVNILLGQRPQVSNAADPIEKGGV